MCIRDSEARVGALQRRLALGGIEIAAVHVVLGTEDTLDLRAQRLEIRARAVQIVACFAQLCGSDKVHGVRDFTRILNAFDSGFNLFCISHSENRLSERLRVLRVFRLVLFEEFLRDFQNLFAVGVGKLTGGIDTAADIAHILLGVLDELRVETTHIVKRDVLHDVVQGGDCLLYTSSSAAKSGG